MTTECRIVVDEPETTAQAISTAIAQINAAISRARADKATRPSVRAMELAEYNLQIVALSKLRANILANCSG